MKKFLLIFLIGQMLVCSFIYGQSFYDIYFLNNMGVAHYNTYYLEEANGVNLGYLYDELMARHISVEIIKEPISMDGIQRYEVYDTKDILVSPIKPLSQEKEIKYLSLKKEDFIDSTGKFKTNASLKQIKAITQKLGITIKPIKKDKISYFQVTKNNAMNLLILLIISQFTLLIYTLSRMKVNAIKKLNGFSSSRMVVDSFSEFIPMQFIACLVTFFLHLSYCLLNRKLSWDYVIGLLLTFIVIELTYDMINSFKIYNSVGFGMPTDLNKHHCSHFRTFLSLHKKSAYMCSFLSVWLCLFWVFHINKIISVWSFMTGFFYLSIIFQSSSRL